MANSKLLKKPAFYKVPDNIIDTVKMNLIKYKNVKSTKKMKARNLVNRPFLTYENMKRYKNLFDTINSQENSEDSENQDTFSKYDYHMLGGFKMLNWLNSMLKNLREPIHKSKKIKTNFADFTNQFRKTHEKSFNKAPELPKVSNFIDDLKPKSLTEIEDVSIDATPISKPIKLEKTATCFLFDVENKLLLLKRPADDHWMPNKYSLVSGMVEENENAKDCIIREIKEETNLDVKGVKFCFKFITDINMVYVFVGKVLDKIDFALDAENVDAQWVTFKQIEKLDIVPNIPILINKLLAISTAQIQPAL